MLIIALAARLDFAQLSVNSPGRDRHDDGLHRTEFFLANPVCPGDAKVVFHSGIAPGGHGRGEVDQHGGLRIEDRVVASGVVKGTVGVVLFSWQHAGTFMRS